MFNWFWEFLYSISVTLFRLIDGLILCANKLCGIDPINVGGEETDFLSYLLFNDTVGLAFRVSALLATILLVIFTIFMIIRSIAKDKAEGTPAQIAVKAFKTILMFFLIPVIMIAFISLANTFIEALYKATAQSSSSLGRFLFSQFAADAGMDAEYVDLFSRGILDYTDLDTVNKYLNINKFPYLFSWLAGGVALFGIGSAMLIFVDRVLSIVILYIAAPISIASSVLDDGARFKLWRDQFISKFIIGYGMILAINIYSLVCGLVMSPDFAFFTGDDDNTWFLNFLIRLLIIGGGALTMQKSMALIGNLVASGAGSNELRDSMTAGGIARAAVGAAKSAAKTAVGVAGVPLKPFKSILGDALSMQSRHLGSRLLSGLHLGGGSGHTTDKNGVRDPDGSRNNDKPNYGTNNSTKQAMNEPGFKTTFSGANTANNNKPTDTKNNPVGSVINNGGTQQGTQSSPNGNNQNTNQNTQNPTNGGNDR